MTKRPQIVIMCSGSTSYPSIQLLSLEKYLTGVIFSGNDAEEILFVKKYCEENDLSFFHFQKKKGFEEMKNWLSKQTHSVVFGIGFQYLVPNCCLSIPNLPFINFHMGKLPEFRGPMPIFETLKSGESETAVSVHFMNESFDKGDMILEEVFAIKAGDTFGSLAVRFADHISLAAHGIAQMLHYGNGLPRKAQSLTSSYYPYPDINATTINWNSMDADGIIDLINACNPWNKGADTKLNRFHYKIVSAYKNNQKHYGLPGQIVHLELNKPVLISCIDTEIIEVTIVCSDYGIEPACRFFERVGKIKI